MLKSTHTEREREREREIERKRGPTKVSILSLLIIHTIARQNINMRQGDRGIKRECYLSSIMLLYIVHLIVLQVSTGQFLVEGEKEALEGKDTVYFTLTAERNHKEGSAEQTHFRLAESQFYRLLSGPNKSLLFPFYFSFLSLYLSLHLSLSFQFISHSSAFYFSFLSLSLCISLSLNTQKWKGNVSQ